MLTVAGIVPRCFEWSRFLRDTAIGAAWIIGVLLVVGFFLWGGLRLLDLLDRGVRRGWKLDQKRGKSVRTLGGLVLISIKYVLQSTAALAAISTVGLVLILWLSHYVC